MALGSQQADKNAAGRQSGAKDRKAIIVDVYYSGPISAAPAARVSAPAQSGGAAPAPVPTAL
jgi:hypothetical protein